MDPDLYESDGASRSSEHDPDEKACEFIPSQALDESPSSSKLFPKLLTVNDMPEEILEHILSFISPYREMDAAKQVSKQWNRVVKSVVKQLKRKFYQSLMKCDVNWTFVTSEVQASSTERMSRGITDRFSHSAVYYDGSMYVFGGCTSTNTTFNDLWRFDLTTRKWIRPIAMGTYPSPKACATMVVYNGNLILFGGWSHPIPYPLHQSAHYFSELHVYSTVTNKWSHILSIGQEPEALGGHSASVAGHLMVVFGGSPRPGMGTNNLWVFNFLKASWMLQPVACDVRPEPRYGQFQTTLDEKHILIMGGCVGQNKVYSDLWLLTLHPVDPWQWTKITTEHPELAAPQTWCHAACRVKDMVVVIARSSKVRQSRNTKTHASSHRTSRPSWSASDSGSADSSPEAAHPAQSLTHHTQENQQLTPQQRHDRSVNHDTRPEREGAQELQPNSNLLTLQQRLHRECLNLPDPSNHQAAANSSVEEDAESHFHRISNRWGSEPGPSSQHSADHHDQAHMQRHPGSPQQNVDQPQFGSLQRFSHHPASGRGRVSGNMPSIRPNAMNNRQKQLEALQRQEELLRSKSRALAAAVRHQRLAESVEASPPVDHDAGPDLITTRNRMDVHVLDISRVLTDKVAEWKPLSELQPASAPTETICCSVLEGRGELMLFGGVVRNTGSPVMTNTAINKLYVLQPQ